MNSFPYESVFYTQTSGRQTFTDISGLGSYFTSKTNVQIKLYSYILDSD